MVTYAPPITQMLLAGPVADLPEPKLPSEVQPIHCVNELVIKAIEALEAASGESRNIYRGKTPTIN